MQQAPITHVTRFLAEDDKIYIGEINENNTATILTGDLFEGTLQRTDQTQNVKKILAPVKPEAIFCIGLNYMKHYEESAKKRGIPPPQKPVIFMKQNNSLCHPGDDIWMPNIEFGEQLDWEVELAIVIGKKCRNATLENALSFVCGYTIGNDVTCRHWQKGAGADQWIKGKSFDTFCPLGPKLALSSFIQDPQNL